MIESWPDRLNVVIEETPPHYWTVTAAAPEDSPIASGGTLDGEVFDFGTGGSGRAYAAPWPGTLESVSARSP